MSTQFIDPANGSLLFSDTFSVSPLTTIAALTTYFSAHEIIINDMNNGWVHYRLRDIYTAENYFILTFYFNHAVLNRIDICVEDKPFKDQSWDDWNEQEERAKEHAYDKWLSQQLGGKRTFEWGSVGAFFDARGGCSYIVLRYEQSIT